MRPAPWQVLLIEDDEDDYLLTRASLAENRGARFMLEWAASPEAALNAVSEKVFDVILVDYNLGTVSGLALMQEVGKLGYRIPFILLTGHGSYELDLEAMQAGATDYLSKREANPILLERTIRYAIERYRLMEENLQQKELLELIFETEPSGLAVMVGPEMRIRYANHAFRASLPDPRQDPIGQPASELPPLLANVDNRVRFLKVLETGQPQDIVRSESIYPDGSNRYFAIHLRRLTWQGEPAVLLISWETTDLIKAQKQLQIAARDAHQRAEELNRVLGQLETEQARVNAVIASAPSGIIMVDPAARIVLTNPIAEQIFGHKLPLNVPYSEWHNPITFLHSNGVPYELDDLPLMHSVYNGETLINVETIFLLPDGQQRSILINSAPIRDTHDQLLGAVAVFVDITEHKKAEQEIRRSLTQIELQRHLMQSRERERLRIAQDLHDGPLQGLISVSFEIKALIQTAKEEQLSNELRHLEQTLQQTIQEIRSFASQLRPPVLAPFGLEKAILSHMDTFREKHPEMNIHLDLAHDGKLLPEETRLALFRIYQELLNNILRHARADEFWVRLALTDKNVELQVQDNGCGFEVPSSWVEMARLGHLGLVGVQERAAAINGNVEINSQINAGSTVRVIVPLD